MLIRMLNTNMHSILKPLCRNIEIAHGVRPVEPLSIRAIPENGDIIMAIAQPARIVSANPIILIPMDAGTMAITMAVPVAAG